MLYFANKKKFFYTIIALFFCMLLTAACKSETGDVLSDIDIVDDRHINCSFDGIRHELILDLPEETKGVPLILMLHGYGNNAESFREMVHIEEEALKCGYAVVYVTGACETNDATSSLGWNSGIGNGLNRDVEFLCAVVSYMEEVYGFDSDSTYAVGFSNGAFMTHRLAMEGSDTFEAFVSVAGKMPQAIWEQRNPVNDISFFQITGSKDDVIPKNSDDTAKYAKDPAIETVMTYWAESNGLHETKEIYVGEKASLTKYYSLNQSNQVWSLWVEDGRHAWPDKDINGISVNLLIMEFLDEIG